MALLGGGKSQPGYIGLFLGTEDGAIAVLGPTASGDRELLALEGFPLPAGPNAADWVKALAAMVKKRGWTGYHAAINAPIAQGMTRRFDIPADVATLQDQLAWEWAQVLPEKRDVYTFDYQVLKEGATVEVISGVFREEAAGGRYRQLTDAGLKGERVLSEEITLTNLYFVQGASSDGRAALIVHLGAKGGTVVGMHGATYVGAVPYSLSGGTPLESVLAERLLAAVRRYLVPLDADLDPEQHPPVYVSGSGLLRPPYVSALATAFPTSTPLDPLNALPRAKSLKLEGMSNRDLAAFYGMAVGEALSL